MNISMRASWVALAAVAFLCATVDGSAEKMKADTLVALHLKAIGGDPFRKNRIAQGMGTLDIRVGGQGKLGGPGMILAEDDKLRASFTFGHINYSREIIIRNGDKLDVAYISPGIRSDLGTALWSHFPRVAQEGLLGGALSTDWTLLDLRKRRAKVRYRGLKTFEGRKLHKLEYRPKKGVGYRIELYFEPETYRHLASSYRLTIPAGLGRGLVNIQAGALGAGDGPADKARITLTEAFSDFKEVDGLTLPHHYKLTLNSSASTGGDSGAGFGARTGFVGHWEIKINRILHDRRIAARAFEIK